MAVCTFFGHHDSPSSIRPNLKTMLIDLIEHHDVYTFYVGNHGAFDAMAWSVLSELRPIYSHIRCTTVLAYMPVHNSCFGNAYTDADTLLPEGIENVPRRYAIIWRNKWMLQQSDCVVTYVVHRAGGAARFEEVAKKQGKTLFCLGKK